jgi:hypothetical protein
MHKIGFTAKEKRAAFTAWQNGSDGWTQIGACPSFPYNNCTDQTRVKHGAFFIERDCPRLSCMALDLKKCTVVEKRN